MKHLTLIFIVLLGELTWANCNFHLAKTSGLCLVELEKAKLRRFQSGACEVLVPFTVTDKSQFLKGADLFSWKDPEGHYWYAVLPGTNRLKTGKEITANKTGLEDLMEKLNQLPPNVEINWNNLTTIDDKQGIEFSIPPKNIFEKIKSQIVKSQLDFKGLDRSHVEK